MKIIIVEDAPSIRNNLKKIFSEIKGLSGIIEAEDSSSAIKLIGETNPDIIILDVELKNSNGFDVLKYVKSDKHSYNPVVIMFSNHINLYKEKAKAYKADFYFDKTNEVDKLISALNTLIV